MELGESVLEMKAAQAKKRHRLILVNHSEWSFLILHSANGRILEICFWTIFYQMTCYLYCSSLEIVVRLLYNISITQISVGGTSADLNFDAIFDSGTSFTYLNDPAYTSISESVSNWNSAFNVSVWSFITFWVHKFTKLKHKYFLLQFNLRAKDKRSSSNSDLPFEYCYDIRSISSAYWLEIFSF